METTQQAIQNFSEEYNKENMQDKLVELIEKKEQLIQQLKDLKPEMEMLMKELGVGHYFQKNNVVYKIEIPKGTFVEFKTVDYTRTRKEGEKGPNFLAKKEAQEMGFKIEGKE